MIRVLLSSFLFELPVLSQSLNVRGVNVSRRDRTCRKAREISEVFFGEFDPGSERTLAAWIRHASRTGFLAFSEI